jgi:tyrosine phenol-lyase
VEGIASLYQKRDRITGLKLAYEPKVLRFFQGRFEPLKEWDF